MLRRKNMKKAFVLIVCAALCGAVLFAQTAANEADFTTKAESGGGAFWS
jgi:hypothetical protein